MKCPHAFFVDPPKGGRKLYTTIDGPHGHYQVEGTLVPCGKCLICRANRSAEWAARLLHELQYHQQHCFITLTYNDENVPHTEFDLLTVNKRDLQLFLKRFRKELKSKIKYFAVSEYGGETKRPHYHAIIFGWQPSLDDLVPLPNGYFSSDFLASTWKLGNVVADAVTPRSIHYVAGYLLKKQFSEEIELGLRKRESLYCSRGIGLEYATDHIDLLRKGNLTAEGVSTAVPRYYIKKLKQPSDLSWLEADRKQLKSHYAVLRRLKNQNKIDPGDLNDYIRLEKAVTESRLLKEHELRQKLNRSRKKL